MTASAGSSNTRAVWTTLIRDRLEQLHNICPFSQTIPSEQIFRIEFYKLPDDLNVPSVERNYAYLVRRHEQMESIVRGLDRALSLTSPDSLSDVFWTYALTALQTAMNHELRFHDFANLYLKLNSPQIPKISSELQQFPENERVQAPLRRIFETYIDCYLTFITLYAEAGDKDDIDTQPILDTIEVAKERYTEAEEEWRARVQEATETQARLTSAMGQVTISTSYNRDTRFEHIRDLGRGSYGVVDEVREITTGSVYARKSIPRRIPGQDSELIENRVRNEATIMCRRLRHNHIASVNIYFRDDSFWSMIMLPVADCDLREFLDEKCVAANFPYDAIRMLDPWFGCLISALAYAHTEMVKHEDIKPHNILIQSKRIYLTDFGTAKDFSEFEMSTVSDYLEAGTPVYWAPEPKPWGRPADIFALGCVFSEMLTVRQKRSLDEYRRFRYNRDSEFGFAYRSNLPKVRKWLKSLEGIGRDPVAETILEQTFNMLVEDSHDRLEAVRLKRNLRSEDALFCDTCL